MNHILSRLISFILFLVIFSVIACLEPWSNYRMPFTLFQQRRYRQFIWIMLYRYLFFKGSSLVCCLLAVSFHESTLLSNSSIGNASKNNLFGHWRETPTKKRPTEKTLIEIIGRTIYFNISHIFHNGCIIRLFSLRGASGPSRSAFVRTSRLNNDCMLLHLGIT